MVLKKFFGLSLELQQMLNKELSSRQSGFIIIAMMVIDLMVGIYHYNAHGIWMDEGFSYAFATASWSDFIRAIHNFDGPIVVWYALLKVWFSVFPPTLFYGRLFSILCGVLTLPAVYLLGYRMFNRKVGLLAALLLLCNTSWWTRQETVRMYALAILVSVLSYITYYMATTHIKGRGTIVTCLLNVFLCGLQFLIGFNQFMAQALTVIMRRTVIKSAVIILSVTFLGLLVWAWIFSHLGKNDTSWVPYIRFNIKSLKIIINAVAGAFGTKVIVGVAVVSGLVALRYSKNREVNVLALWIIIPIITSIVVSIFKPILGERYLLGCIAPVCILMAVGILSVKPKWSVALFVLVIGAESYGLYHMDHIPHEDWAVLTPTILHNVRPGDVVDVYSRMNVVGFVSELKLENRHLPSGVILYPEHADTQWSSADIQDHAFPRQYVTGKNSVFVVLAGHNVGHQVSKTYWPPTSGYDDLLQNYKKCWQIGSPFYSYLMVLKYDKTCSP
jgi:hypothetical protein